MEEVERIDLEIDRATDPNDDEAMRKVLKEAQIAEASVIRVLQHCKELNLEPVRTVVQHDEAPRKRDDKLLSAASLRQLSNNGEAAEAADIEDKLWGLKQAIEDAQKGRKEKRMASLLKLKRVPSTDLDSIVRIVRESQESWIMPDSKEYVNALEEQKAHIIKLEEESKTMWLVFLSTLHNSLANCGMLGASHDMIPYS